MIWLPLLKRYAPIIAILFSLGLAYAYHLSALNSAKRAGYQAAQAEMAKQVSAANTRTAALEQHQREQSEAAAAAWSKERDELQGQVVDLLARGVSVRLCKQSTGSRQLPEKPGASAGAAEATSRPVDGVSAGRDIGPEILRYGADCDRYRAQLSALQRWVSETTKAQPSD